VAKYVAILGTLDTKGAEVEFLRQRVRAEGGEPLVVDTGVLGSPSVSPDIDRYRVAEAGGSSIQALIQGKDKSHALVVMADGASRILLEYLERGELGGVLSIGGSRGTALGTRVMQTLPVGVPKLMVSTVASGENTFGPFVGTRDVTMMHSVADIQGVNAVTRPIFSNAVAAVVGMSRVGLRVERGEWRILVASMLGVTTALVSQIQALMEPDGCEVIAFHAVGSGGRSMEELIESGLVEGVFDLTPGEVTAHLVNGKFSAGPERMCAASRLGIPQVVAPGGIDFIIEGPPDQLPSMYRSRLTMQHTPLITLVRTSPEEMAATAQVIAGRLNDSKGPVEVILPLQAFGWFALPGQPLYDPDSDQAFRSAFKECISPRVKVVEIDTHLNDPQVGELAVEMMQEMLGVIA